ncbi:MAG: hypothetical protein QGH51_03645 [Planctomycetota bacterium]|jgi:hypothetical protein|nr:hypothetical protein [Planctomycetota bacterium]MDP6941101.1 hypothetical protein [Planctomycetota bacterium]
MNLDAFWQANRRFLIGVAIGLVSFLILGSILVSGPKKAAASSRRSIMTATRTLRGKHVSSQDVARARTRLEALKKQGRKLAELALPIATDGFVIPEGQSPSKHYIEFTGARRQELISAGLLRDMEIDESLGLPAVSPSQPQIIAKVLHGFFVVDQMMRLAIDYGAESVDDIAISTRSSRPGTLRASLLDITTVELEVSIQEERLRPLLQKVVAHDPPLGLVRMEVLPVDKKGSRSILFEFGVGSIPETQGEEE